MMYDKYQDFYRRWPQTRCESPRLIGKYNTYIRIETQKTTFSSLGPFFKTPRRLSVFCLRKPSKAVFQNLFKQKTMTFFQSTLAVHRHIIKYDAVPATRNTSSAGKNSYTYIKLYITAQPSPVIQIFKC